MPISRLAECIGETKRDLAQSSIPSALVGHVGDGNFHLIFMIDPQSPEEIAEASRLNDRMVARALAMEGTCTGEHGIGYGKMDFLAAEHGEAVSVMRSIKQALDPDNIMNPGKIVRICDLGYAMSIRRSRAVKSTRAERIKSLALLSLDVPLMSRRARRELVWMLSVEVIGEMPA